MKFLFGQFVYILKGTSERNLKMLMKFFLLLITMITVYSVLFHFLMMLEDKKFSWITGFYWTLTVMSTLGFGDITFDSDLGKLFSMVVLLSGIVLLLIMLPFTFIQFFYAPWLEAQTKARAPRKLPEDIEDHVILTNYDPITMNLVDRLRQYQYEYVIVMEDVKKALELIDLDYKVVVGELGDPDTYRRLKVEKATLVVANIDDMMNTNIAFTVREVSKEVPIVANADLDDSVDILQLAGSTHVFQFMKLLGQSLARRVLRTSAQANVIGSIDSLLLAEAPAMRTTLVGKTLQQSRLRETTGLTIVGVWEKGMFENSTAATRINSTTVLLLAGTTEQLKNYDERFGGHQKFPAPVLILGGGRVGRAAAEALEEGDIDYRIIEKNKRLVEDDRYIYGSAADISILEQAGIKKAPSVIITTHDDPTNIYLTIYCRRLRPDIQIISRATLDRSISKLHTAGADLVMSYASLAANTILNLLKPDEVLMLAEGLNVFRVGVHSSLINKSLAESQIRMQTGCSVIAIKQDGKMVSNPDPSLCFRENDELIMIGTNDAEKRFFKMYSEGIRLKSS
ncbi:MAG TPA: potassium channel protein [Deltaproteobacteria bacterium]|nr:potassium channel protein [Deltaproteobacteria bacterium]HIJ40789.1 potassium channel protein [Deltaproteobacteria bacterium]